MRQFSTKRDEQFSPGSHGCRMMPMQKKGIIIGIFLTLAFLFFIGSTIGWVMELIFRRFFSGSNPERKWINPGFCTGPWLPIYGFGLCALFLLASLGETAFFRSSPWGVPLLVILMGAVMTAIEYVAGIVMLRVFQVRLWDYHNMPGNVQGVICPQFTLIWTALGALYIFLIHPYIRGALVWLSRNLAFSFVIGMFYGVFFIDVAHAMQLAARLKRFAKEYQVILRYETIKQQIRAYQEVHAQRPHFFRPFHTERPLPEHLKEMRGTFEGRSRRARPAKDACHGGEERMDHQERNE